MDEIINVPLHWTNRRLDDRRGLVIKEPDRDGDYRIQQRVWEHSDAVRTVLDLELSADEADQVAALLQLFAGKVRTAQHKVAA